MAEPRGVDPQIAEQRLVIVALAPSTRRPSRRSAMRSRRGGRHSQADNRTRPPRLRSKLSKADQAAGDPVKVAAGITGTAQDDRKHQRDHRRIERGRTRIETTAQPTKTRPPQWWLRPRPPTRQHRLTGPTPNWVSDRQGVTTIPQESGLPRVSVPLPPNTQSTSRRDRTKYARTRMLTV